MKKLLVIGLISSNLVLGGCFKQVEIPEIPKQMEIRSQSGQAIMTGSSSDKNTMNQNDENYWKKIQNFECQRFKEPRSELTQLEGAKQPFFFINETCQSLSNSGNLSIVTVPYTDIYIIRRTGS